MIRSRICTFFITLAAVGLLAGSQSAFAQAATSAEPEAKQEAAEDKDKDAKADEDSSEEKSESSEDAKEPAVKPKPKVDPRVKRIAEMEAEMKELKTTAALQKARQDAELSALKLELEKISTEASLESARRKKATASFALEADLLVAENALLKQKFTKLKQQSDIATLENMAQMSELSKGIAIADHREKAKARVLKEVDYSDRPFQDGCLYISDRRIAMNGVVTSRTANYVTERIHFFNNLSDDPIFIVIDDSPGGSVMAGYRILKAMEASEAPIHVVVKSFAASMAAVITTLADNSYAYPNAILLHHQMSSSLSGNMTQQAEQLEVNKEWARRLMGPLCQKLEISPEKFVAKMYENSSTGDWEEFADRAQELGWVDNIATGIREQSVSRKPTTSNTSGTVIFVGSQLEPLRFDGEEEIDERGTRFRRLPRLHPYDCYFVHNPDGYYRN